MHTMSLTGLSAASRIAAVAKRAGTKMMLASAPVERTASSTRVEHGHRVDARPALARSDAAYHLGTVGEHAPRMEGTVPSRDALNDDFRIPVHQDAHAAPPFT